MSSREATMRLVGGLLELEREQPGHTAKQYLLLLRHRRLLNDQQVRALAARLDELRVEMGEGDALTKVLEEFDRGELKLLGVGGAPANTVRPPCVFDAPQGESPKQILLFLHQHGALSMVQVQAAAHELVGREKEMIAAGAGALSVHDVAELLFDLDLRNALPEGWTPDSTQPAASAQSIEPQREEDDDAFVNDHTVKSFVAWLEGQTDPLLLGRMEAAERRAQNRKGVLDAIQERIGELMLGTQD